MGLLHGKVNSKSKDIIINQLLVIQYKFDTKIIYWPSHHRAKQSEASAASPGHTIRFQQQNLMSPLQAKLKQTAAVSAYESTVTSALLNKKLQYAALRQNCTRLS